MRQEQKTKQNANSSSAIVAKRCASLGEAHMCRATFTSVAVFMSVNGQVRTLQTQYASMREKIIAAGTLKGRQEQEVQNKIRATSGITHAP